MAVVYFSPIFNGYQSFLPSGLPNANGFIYTYQAGTSTPLATYTTVLGTIANANPITLNSSGFPVASGNITEIWLNSSFSYKFVVTDALNNVLATYDNVPGIAGNVSFFFTIGQTSVITTQGQTLIPLTFTYSQGSNSIQVYRNGAKQVIATDYTESSTTSVTLIVSAIRGEQIEVVGTITGSGGVGTVTHSLGNLTASALVVGNGGADINVLSSLGTATTVLHGNATGLPTFGAVSLSTDVSGTLQAAQMPSLTNNAILTGGGPTSYPNAVVLTGILVGNGASAPTSITAPSGTIVGTTDSQALTNKTYNGLTITSSTGTLTVSNGKTITGSNSITLAGTDGKNITATNSLTITTNDGTIAFGSSSATITFQGSDTYVGRATTDTLTNKRVTARTASTTSSGTPTINTDNVDTYRITALSAAITSMTTNLSGTPNTDDGLIIEITDNGSARAITWGTSFEASGNVALPTTTVISTKLTVGFLWNPVTTKWTCVGVA